MSVEWKSIYDGMDKLTPRWRSRLPGPADPAAIAAVEKWFGHPLPEDFKDFYLAHDGSGDVHFLAQLMSLERIEQAWGNWEMLVEDNDDLSGGIEAYPPDAVKPLYANKAWLPFAGNEELQNAIALDFDPGPAGKVGQVINFGVDDDFRCVIADSFAGYVAFVGEQFRQGRVVHQEGGYQRLMLGGKDRDFIQSLPYSVGHLPLSKTKK